MTHTPPALRDRPGPHNPARELAVRVLIRVLAGEAFAAPALDAALQQARLPGRDAGLATHIVYGTLRRVLSLQAALSPLLRGPTHPKTRALLLAGAFEKLYLGTPVHAVVSDYVNLARAARLAPPGLVNAVLRRVTLDGVAAGPEAEVPAWLAELYRRAYGDAAERVLADLLEPQPLWLSLSDEGVRALESEGSVVKGGPQGVDRVSLERPLRQTAAYSRGQAQPINPASLACVDALGDVAGARVLDLAGGAGVKAAMLATRGAKVTSVDLVGAKHEAARANLRRLGLKADFLTHDLTRPLAVDPAPFVLLDAPCTGSGTLRSHPEIKLRLTPDAVDEMARLQGQMLPNAAALVAPGGTLVYSVCSVTPQEGPEVVARFLETQPGFAAESVPGLEVPHVPAGPGVLTVPEGGIDGFFIARLRRQA
ncbi:RsmB/NOP family class I SAM-dependent RNA methyltransferase [Deinococcus multiflagellatus]|uniref:RsmB/NOP family class I SAM-dependent RNA methyltransferase n=1 Tax=Deinococcus multiflagellatus TaxID=1656887 RepID=UPI001CCF7BFC|nr:RsmB/NOP family class I SAM-dependent RNA methyltransferase [Deinococcus multiflagellatus]MBZ9712896.1 RsmB/NOP family class I SAM-dependent RNA methyltransferase [Deinococcus multiflagellatus]